jgi:hypothetical protein
LGQCQNKRKVDAENRQFQDNWTEDYYFILNKGLPVCLLCDKSISVDKGYNLKRHFTSRHADNQKIDTQLRRDEIQKLKKNLDAQQQRLNKQRTQHHSIVKASLVVSEKIAKHSKSFGEGEFIKECLVDVASICPEKEKKKDFENICLSRRTVVRRIEMMADDIRKSLKEKIARLEAFSMLWMTAPMPPIQHN